MVLHKGVLSITVLVCLAPVVAAQPNSEYERIQLVSERKMLMFDMQTAYLSLLAIRQGRSDDLSKAANDAQLISDKMSSFVEVLSPGTAEGEVPNSRAKPEVWTEPEAFSDAVEELLATTTLLSETAHTGDLDAFNQKFDAVAEACVGCHELKPSGGGRFRAPK